MRGLDLPAGSVTARRLVVHLLAETLRAPTDSPRRQGFASSPGPPRGADDHQRAHSNEQLFDHEADTPTQSKSARSHVRSRQTPSTDRISTDVRSELAS